MRTIAVINQKGGCGKTTTAINLAGVFARMSRRTLLVDMDPQAHCAAGLAIPEQRIDLHIGDAMTQADGAGEHGIDTGRLLWRVSRNLDLAPSTMKLAAIEAPRGEFGSLKDPEKRLARVLRTVEHDYELCIIDCSPAIGLLAFNAIAAADELIIPVETGFFSLQGAAKQVSTVRSLGKRLGVEPACHLLATMHDPASALANDLLHELRRRFTGQVVPIVIRSDDKLREAVSFGQPVIEYASDSPGARDYSALARWLLERSDASQTTSETPQNGAQEDLAVHVVRGIGDKLSSNADDAMNGSERTAVASRAAEIAAQARRLQKIAPAPTDGPPEAPATPNEQPAPEANASSKAPPVGPSPDRTAPAETASPPSPTPVVLPGSQPMLYGTRPVQTGVRFVQPLSIGRAVCIACDLNGWSADATPMAPDQARGVFELVLPFEPGMRQYRLIVDGQWMPDPYNPLMAPNPFGESNSVVVVPERRRRATTSTDSAAGPTSGPTEPRTSGTSDPKITPTTSRPADGAD